MKELKTELKRKLKEIFQFENEDLNFGIYRIINYKRKEIEEFIEEKLINEIKKQLKLVSNEETERIRKEFEELKQRIKENLGKNAFDNGELKEEFKNTPLGKEYYEKKKQVEEIKISEDLEREIYNHLINFFSRYYDKGDFISKRRYGKNEKYIIPYNGDEVLLYWVNKDQYYIKTTEYFRKYTFWDKHKFIKVNFRVINAEEEKGNIKSTDKKFFVLKEEIFNFDEEKRELDIYFEYRTLTSEEKERYKYGNSVSQDKANEEIIKVLEQKIPQNSLARLIFEKEGDKTLIEKHLYRYTRRNTTDYFIHKNLKRFLERELDFYIKNEFLQLEDLRVLEESGYFDKLRLYLIGVKAFRNIALKIIEFLAQIENFQKKIWEKKKFVIDTHYVITLDKIKEYAGEEFLESILDDILRKEKQLDEWKELFGIEVKSEKNLKDKGEWKKLPIDTKYFDEEFKWKLLVALTKENNLDEILDGVLIKSENWQALNLLLNKYYEKVQTIYIDPPFNKEQEADYLYKVGYKDATWITMLENRIRLGRDLLNERGSIFVRCDYNGNMYVRMLLNEIFGWENFRNEIVVKRGAPKAEMFKQFKDIKSLGVLYDNLYFYTKTIKARFKGLKKQVERREGYWSSFYDMKPSGARPTMVYELLGLYPPKGYYWKWGKERALKGVENYEKYLSESQRSDETIDHFSQRTGIRDFVKKEKNRIRYYVHPKEETFIDNNWLDIAGYSNTTGFKTENSEILLKRVIESTSNEGNLTLDFFLGSGTTTAVAHKLKRKWIGVEMGDHLWTVVLPRMKKVLFYNKAGISKEKKVKERYNFSTAGGFFKYHTLEQYEDALENVEFEKPQKALYELTDYFVKYMLKWETKGSKTFLNIDEMKDPFNYKLKIIENYQQKTVNVDLVETFNYLIGLNVSKYKVLQENGRKYVFVFGEKDGKRIVIVWRSIKDIDFEKDKEVIEAGLKGFESDEIYINGEALVKGFRHIEPLFKSLMFEKVE